MHVYTQISESDNDQRQNNYLSKELESREKVKSLQREKMFHRIGSVLD